MWERYDNCSLCSWSWADGYDGVQCNCRVLKMQGFLIWELLHLSSGTNRWITHRIFPIPLLIPCQSPEFPALSVFSCSGSSPVQTQNSCRTSSVIFIHLKWFGCFWLNGVTWAVKIPASSFYMHIVNVSAWQLFSSWDKCDHLPERKTKDKSH